MAAAYICLANRNNIINLITIKNIEKENISTANIYKYISIRYKPYFILVDICMVYIYIYIYNTIYKIHLFSTSYGEGGGG